MDQATHHGSESNVADQPSHDEQYDDDVEQIVHDVLRFGESTRSVIVPERISPRYSQIAGHRWKSGRGVGARSGEILADAASNE